MTRELTDAAKQALAEAGRPMLGQPHGRDAGPLLERLRDSRYIGQAGMRGEAADEIIRLREFVAWVDSWVSNPIGSYSVSALDGLFGMTRDKIAALANRQSHAPD